MAEPLNAALPEEVPEEITAGLVDPERVYAVGMRRTACAHVAVGKREEKLPASLRGKYARDRFPEGVPRDIALGATLRAAALRHARSPGIPLRVDPVDLRVKIRRHRSPYAVVFVVDNSWSTHVEATLQKVKGVVLELLRNAAQYHDKVGLVAFRHNRNPDAAVCLPLTRSYALAARRLRRIRLSGTTPLADGIRKGLGLLRQEQGKHHNTLPVLVIVTDGLPNVPLHKGGDPYADIEGLARHLRRRQIMTIVVDTEARGAGGRASLCRKTARTAGGRYIPLSGLSAGGLEAALSRIHDRRRARGHVPGA